MADNPIASDLSYRVLQRQRGELQQSAAPLHQANQRANAAVVRGTKEDILTERLTGESAEPESQLWVRGSHE